MTLWEEMRETVTFFSCTQAQRELQSSCITRDKKACLNGANTETERNRVESVSKPACSQTFPLHEPIKSLSLSQNELLAIKSTYNIYWLPLSKLLQSVLFDCSEVT